MRSAVYVFTAAPLLVFVLNVLTYRDPPRRRLRVASSSPPSVHSQPPPSASPHPPSPAAPGPATSSASSSVAADCSGREHLELWGSLVQAGGDNDQPTAADCCRSCREYEPSLDVGGGAQCNAWVWHPISKECWLKHQSADDLRHSVARVAQAGSPAVPWHSGVNLEVKPCADCVPPAVYSGCISKDVCNTSRACGSPAVGAYSKVVPGCLEQSPTAKLYEKLLAAGTQLVGHVDLAADYDGRDCPRLPEIARDWSRLPEVARD